MDDNYRAQRRSFAVVVRRSGNRPIEPEVVEVRNAFLVAGSLNGDTRCRIGGEHSLSPLEETRFELPVPLSQTVCGILSNQGRSVPPSSAKNG